jgi:hypothetical protein
LRGADLFECILLSPLPVLTRKQSSHAPGSYNGYRSEMELRLGILVNGVLPSACAAQSRMPRWSDTSYSAAAM